MTPHLSGREVERNTAESRTLRMSAHYVLYDPPPVWPGGGEEYGRVPDAEPLVPLLASHNLLVEDLPRLVPVQHPNQTHQHSVKTIWHSLKSAQMSSKANFVIYHYKII